MDVTPSWVYAHAAEFHAVRLGGDTGRLRFDLDEVQRCLNGNVTNGRRRVPQRRRVMDAGGELLPIAPNTE